MSSSGGPESRFASCSYRDMANRDENINTPEQNENVDANTRNENQHKQEQQDDREQVTGRVPAKGTDTPATTDPDSAIRDKGKRITM